jgi:hypothetical protein
MWSERTAEIMYFAHQWNGPERRFPWPKAQDDGPTWVTLRPGFISEEMQIGIDAIDWHGNLKRLENPNFWTHKEGLSDQGNAVQLERLHYPWWFVGSAHRSLPIWEDMPITKGHAMIDLWMLNYRHVKGYIDITPPGFPCYHQRHYVTATEFQGEQEAVSVEEIERLCGTELGKRDYQFSVSTSQDDLWNLLGG